MNRTDRLYALVEELRAAAPRPRSARSLAAVFDVSTRTVERDLSALQQAGVPIWAEPGRTGGYCIDPAHTLAPLGFTVDEALAITIALGMLSTSPFQRAATSALRKVVAVTDAESLRRTAELAARIHFLEDPPAATPDAPAESRAREALAGLDGALTSGRVLRLAYRDRAGTQTVRDVEPLGYVGKGGDWYLVGWCRLRDGVRAFRGDRILQAEQTGERVAARPVAVEEWGIVHGELRAAGPGPAPA